MTVVKVLAMKYRSISWAFFIEAKMEPDSEVSRHGQIRMDGDKLVRAIIETKVGNSLPGTSPGTAKVFSGTGKCVGMQGTMDWVLRFPKPFPEGTGRGICKKKVKLLPSNSVLLHE
jgi:hypothetical protein